MRPISELFDFLENRMSMQAVYQPVVILHLLTREGYATRADLARTLSGYDEMGLEYWDRVLMDNPKRWLVGKHKLIDYDRENQTFTLSCDLSDTSSVKKAQIICEVAILNWIQWRFESESLDETELLRHYRVLELAKRGESYGHSLENEDSSTGYAIDEFAMRVAIAHLYEQHPTDKITQQPYGTPGFDILVGTAESPTICVKVKATQKPLPTFTLTEGERHFSIEKSRQYALALIYDINLKNETYQIKLHRGEITHKTFVMTPLHWQMKFL